MKRAGKSLVPAVQGCALRTLTVMFLSLCYAASGLQTNASDHATLILVVGAAGEPEFGSNFVQQARLWRKVGQQGGCKEIVLGLDNASQTNDFDQLKQILAEEPKDGPAALWLVLIGHGSFDGKEARFNLRGPDVTATELGLWLQPFRRPLAIIDTTSSSAPFLNKLSATNRVVITATRSGHEQNFARFGQYLAEAIADPRSDLDKDGSVSLLEAFLMASRRTAEFYRVEGRLATEHALLDDNGDGLGTPADWFRGLRVIKKPKSVSDKPSPSPPLEERAGERRPFPRVSAPLPDNSQTQPQEDAAADGLLARQFHFVPTIEDQTLTAEQRARRDALERAVLLYREKKGRVPEDEYYRELEKLLLDLVRSYGSNSPASQ